MEASPDGEGYCCVPEEPSCDGTIVGGFIEEADEDCGLLQAFDYSPTSFGALMTDEHGCDYYDPAPGEACNPAPDAGP